jgi:hypothetical protein
MGQGFLRSTLSGDIGVVTIIRRNDGEKLEHCSYYTNLRLLLGMALLPFPKRRNFVPLPAAGHAALPSGNQPA